MKHPFFYLFSILILFLSSHVYSQDRRAVTEPQVPKICTTLYADKKIIGDRNLSDADELKKDTQRIQAALDHCKKGFAVALKTKRENSVFLSGPIEMRDGVSLILDEGVSFFASRDPRDFDYADGIEQCAFTESESRVFGQTNSSSTEKKSNEVKPSKKGCRPLFAMFNVNNVGIYGKGTIDGRGDQTLIGKDYSWWQMARKAEPGNQKYYSVRLVIIRNANNITLEGIHLHNSPNFHVTANDTQGFTVWGIHLHTPTDPHADARNTDGIDPGSSSDITIAHSWIFTDDDNIAIKTGTHFMSVLHNHFYAGHGMSIGSETNTGVSDLLVDDLTLDHTTSGIRIKSNVMRGGPVSNLTYQNICMRDIGVPFAISPWYANKTTEPFEDPGYQGNKIPDYKNIRLRNITALTPSDILIAGKDAQHITEILFDNVNINGITEDKVHGAFSNITLKNSPIPFKNNSEKNIQVIESNTADQKPYDCDNKFLPMQ